MAYAMLRVSQLRNEDIMDSSKISFANKKLLDVASNEFLFIEHLLSLISRNGKKQQLSTQDLTNTCFRQLLQLTHNILPVLQPLHNLLATFTSEYSQYFDSKPSATNSSEWYIAINSRYSYGEAEYHAIQVTACLIYSHQIVTVKQLKQYIPACSTITVRQYEDAGGLRQFIIKHTAYFSLIPNSANIVLNESRLSELLQNVTLMLLCNDRCALSLQLTTVVDWKMRVPFSEHAKVDHGNEFNKTASSKNVEELRQKCREMLLVDHLLNILTKMLRQNGSPACQGVNIVKLIEKLCEVHLGAIGIKSSIVSVIQGHLEQFLERYSTYFMVLSNGRRQTMVIIRQVEFFTHEMLHDHTIKMLGALILAGDSNIIYVCKKSCA
jgi:hypothetical protein